MIVFLDRLRHGARVTCLVYIYKQCKHHTKICVFCIGMDSFWNHVIYVWIV